MKFIAAKVLIFFLLLMAQANPCVRHQGKQPPPVKEVTSNAPEIIEIPIEVDVQASASDTFFEQTGTGRCVCAMFAADKSPEDAEPIFAYPTIDVRCHATGQEYCNRICNVIQEVTAGISSSIVCSVLRHSDPVRVSVYSKTCDSHQYVYTGITETSAICCHKGKVINCDEAKKGYDEEMC